MPANTVFSLSVTQLSFSISRTAAVFADAPKIITGSEKSILARSNIANDSFYTKYSKGINSNRVLGNIEDSAVTEKTITVKGQTKKLTSTFSKSINTYNPTYSSDNVDYLGANGKITFTGYANSAFGNSNFGKTLTPVFKSNTSNSNGLVSYTQFDDTKIKITFEKNLKITVGNSLTFYPKKSLSSTIKVNAVDFNQLPDLKVKKSLDIKTSKTLFDSPLISTTALVSIRVKDVSTIGYFTQNQTASFAAISNQNDPRILYIPGTAVAPDATLVQVWF